MFLANALKLAKAQRESMLHIGRRCKLICQCVILPLKFLRVSEWDPIIKIQINTEFSMGTDMIVACASD